MADGAEFRFRVDWDLTTTRTWYYVVGQFQLAWMPWRDARNDADDDGVARYDALQAALQWFGGSHG